MIVERTDDVDLAFAIEQAAGMKRGRVEIARRFALSEGYVARSDAGDALGVGTSCFYPNEKHDAPPALAWIGGMAVRPDARRQGAARAILSAMRSRAAELDVGTVGAGRERASAPRRADGLVIGLDASEMGRPLYEREGFRALGRSSRWARAEARVESITSERHSVHPISVSEAVEVSAYDLPRFGARRMPSLMALLHAFPWHAFMARERASGDVSGFIFASERTMGPLVADDADAAAVLLSACERSGAPPKLLAMDDDASTLEVLRAAGYAPDGAACTRMTLEGRALPGRRASVRGIATWALG